MATSGEEVCWTCSNECSIERLYEVVHHGADKIEEITDTFEQMFECVLESG
jgi:hypothetical protein